jgi:hypothetical protein
MNLKRSGDMRGCIGAALKIMAERSERTSPRDRASRNYLWDVKKLHIIIPVWKELSIVLYPRLHDLGILKTQKYL